jgi:group I intron endonuclease
MPVAIYKITSPSNNIYIGQTWDFEKRKYQYSKYSCKNQTFLYSSLKKYGFENHKIEVIAELPDDIDQKTLNFYECTYYDFYLNAGYPMMNLRIPNEIGGGKMSDESRRRMSEAKKGYVITEETRRKLSAALKNRPKAVMTDDVKKKISISKLGTRHTEESKMMIKKNNKMKKMVTDLVTGKTYDSALDASKELKINYQTIISYLNGSRTNKTNLIYANI